MDRLLIRIKRFIPNSIFNFLQPFYHWGLALTGAIIYGFPSRSMKVAGVTGTSGKTTTVELLYEIFSKAGLPSAAISTLRFRMPDKTELNLLKMTTPGRFKTQKLLRDAKRAGVKYVFLEITSEGIKQYRHKFIKFCAAILTNLSEEHLESHGGFENYRRAKAELFKVTPIHILNGDDENFDFFNWIPAKKKIVYKKADYPKGLKTQLPGEFNKNNILAALTFARLEGIPDEVSFRAIGEVSVMPGRMEFVETHSTLQRVQGRPVFDSEVAQTRGEQSRRATSSGQAGKRFKVLVDYAFIPKALEKVYQALNQMGYKRLIAVTGAAGGGRDRWKRPLVGDVAAKYCVKVFVTNEDPYDEDPMKIIDEVIGSHKDFIKILDRREAIREALIAAKRGEGEVVVITGKGAEPWIMGPQGTKLAWDDREVAREELKKLKGTMTKLKTGLVNYFGYGANSSLKMIEAIIGRRPEGSDFYLDNYELVIQSWEEVPDDVQQALKRYWDPSFRTHCIRPVRAKRVFGRLWQITPEERKLITAWEFWYEPITLRVETKRGSIEIETEIMNSPKLEVVNGENYPVFLNNEKKMLDTARETREETFGESH